jgi:hypothetical protein
MDDIDNIVQTSMLILQIIRETQKSLQRGKIQGEIGIENS